MSKRPFKFILGVLLALVGVALLWNGDTIGQATINTALVLGVVGIVLIAYSHKSRR
jgi:drug/metabolite transporter (DMT)-like permease